MDRQTKTFSAEIKQFDESSLTVEHFISTEDLDRGGDIMRVDGMEIKGKPVVLLEHGFGPMGREPIAKPVSIAKGTHNGKRGIVAKTQFYPDDLGKRLFAKATQGYMPNWSIGYVAKEWRDVPSALRDQRYPACRDVTQWELLEYSMVGVPMNPEAQTLEAGDIAFKIMSEKESDVDEQDKVLAEEDVKDFHIDGEWVTKDGEVATWEMKPYPNEHACRMNPPDKYKRVRRQNDKFQAGVHAIWGVTQDGKVELQAIRLDKSKFTVDEAKKWLKDHDFTCSMFEPATGEEKGGCEDDPNTTILADCLDVVRKALSGLGDARGFTFKLLVGPPATMDVVQIPGDGSETVEVPVEDLKAVLERLDSLERTVASQAKADEKPPEEEEEEAPPAEDEEDGGEKPPAEEEEEEKRCDEEKCDEPEKKGEEPEDEEEKPPEGEGPPEEEETSEEEAVEVEEVEEEEEKKAVDGLPFFEIDDEPIDELEIELKDDEPPDQSFDLSEVVETKAVDEPEPESGLVEVEGLEVSPEEIKRAITEAFAGVTQDIVRRLRGKVD